MLYYNPKKERFEVLKSQSKTDYKILLTEEILRKNRKGYYGVKNSGSHWSKINDIDFLWDELEKVLIDPDAKIRIWHPNCTGYQVCLGWDE